MKSHYNIVKIQIFSSQQALYIILIAKNSTARFVLQTPNRPFLSIHSILGFIMILLLLYLFVKK